MKFRIIISLIVILIFASISFSEEIEISQPVQETPTADDIDYEDEYMGVIHGFVAECDPGGPYMDNVEVYVQGHNELLAVTDNGAFTAYLPGGTYNLKLVHPDYTTKILEQVVVHYINSPESEIPLETYMSYPDFYITPNAIGMHFNPGFHTSVDETFEFYNMGCGGSDYFIDIIIYEPDVQANVFFVNPGSGFINYGAHRDITITFRPSNDPDFELPSSNLIRFVAVITGSVDTEVILSGEVVIGNYDPTPGLHQNSPNPFNPTTTIQFDLQKQQDVRLTVFNLMGQEVAKLVDGNLESGHHSVNFDGSHLASGIYFYRIETPEFSDMKKMVIMK